MSRCLRSSGMATRRNFSGARTSSTASSTGSNSPMSRCRCARGTRLRTRPESRRSPRCIDVPWEPRRDAWGSVTELSEEMKRLDHLLDRDTLDPQGGRARTRAAREAALVASGEPAHRNRPWRLPVLEHPVQRSHESVAVIDWEISMIGPTLLDLGWICFFADRASFGLGTEVNRGYAAERRRDRRRLCERPPASDSGGPGAMVPRIRGIPLRRDHLLQRDAASPRQAPRSTWEEIGAVGAPNVRTRARTARLISASSSGLVAAHLCAGIALALLDRNRRWRHGRCSQAAA